MSLYHFTCDHAYAKIGEAGQLLPAINLARKADRLAIMRDTNSRMTSQVVWMTTAHRPSRWELGLTRFLTCCDRMQHRYRVTEELVLMRPWSDVRLDWPRSVVVELEMDPRCLPASWWVSRGPVSVEYSPIPSRQRAMS